MSAAARQPSIKALVLAYLEANKPAMIDPAEMAAIHGHVTAQSQRGKPVSRRYLLEILSSTDVGIARSLGGLPVDLRHRVHSHDQQTAAASLLDMQNEYEAAREKNDRVRAGDCRRAVMQAKDRLKLVLRRRNLAPERRAEKQEVLEWFLVWLENPSVFEQWLQARRRALGLLAPAARSENS
jgi:hypothetical protein